MDFRIKENTILVVPNRLKKEILINCNELVNVKIMTLEEFKDNYLFTYDTKAIYYLMKKYNLKYDVARMYLDNMVYLRIENIQDDKINKLKSLKLELDNNNLLIYNPLFKDYLKTKEIIVYGYYLNKFEKNLFDEVQNSKIITPGIEMKNYQIYEFDDIEDEIVFVAIKIIELIEHGVDIEKIKICNVSNDDELIIKRIFDFYNIPITFSDSLYKMSNVIQFLNLLQKGTCIDEALSIIKDEEILNKVVSICNTNYFDNFNDKTAIEILKNIFKNTKIDTDLNKKKIVSIDLDNANDDDYIFLIGFNQGVIPKIYKNEDYLSDDLKASLGIDTSITNNIREKEKIRYNINRIKNLVISYRNKSPYETYIKNSIIDEFNMEVISNYEVDNKFNYSLPYNQVKLASDLDLLNKYNIKNPSFDKLYSNFKIPYKSYDNKFTGINPSDLKEYLDNKLLLSYSSLDNYYRCGFKYYIKNILKLDKYEETFAIFIGNLFHDILSKAFTSNFDFEKEFNDYLPKKELTSSEFFFINKLKKDLLFTIDTIKEQNKYTKFNKELYEEKIYVNKDNSMKITFMGVVDKIKILEEENKSYIAIIDYKTGLPDTNLGYTMYGINMQLPVYLYLVNNCNRIKNAEVVGFYLQKIINNKIKKCEDIDKKRKEQLKLEGFSINNEKLLEKFDSTYKDSMLIKSMKVGNNGFYAYSKVLNKKQMEKLLELVNKKIDQASLDIVEGKFDINPKRIGDKLIGCEFCKFKDLCYRTEKDIVDLEEYKNYDFLEFDSYE